MSTHTASRAVSTVGARMFDDLLLLKRERPRKSMHRLLVGIVCLTDATLWPFELHNILVACNITIDDEAFERNGFTNHA